MSNEARVWVQLWEESERGWGVRQDGASIHRSQEQAQAYIKAYWDRMLRTAPGEYSRPCDGKIRGQRGDVSYELETGYMQVPMTVVAAIPADDAQGQRFWGTAEAFLFLTAKG